MKVNYFYLSFLVLFLGTHGYKSNEEHFPFPIIMMTDERKHLMFLIEDITT